jgi:hypothetical protein
VDWRLNECHDRRRMSDESDDRAPFARLSARVTGTRPDWI